MKIHLLIICFIFFIPSVGHNQSWLQRADLPFTIQNSEGTSFAIGDKVYVVCGVVNNNYSNFCWEFNTTSNTWTQKTSLPVCPRRWPCSFAVGGNGYLFGGYDTCSGSQNDLWKYDPINDSWLQKASLPDSVRSGAIAWSINGKGYILCGAQSYGVTLNDCWQYDPILDSWIQKSSMPCTGRVFGTGFSIGSKGFAGLGTDYSQYLKDWWEYDSNSDTWAIKDSLPSGAMDISSFAIDSFGYVGPGDYPSVLGSTFFQFDQISGHWLQLANFPGSQYTSCYSVSCNGKGYVISGNSFTSCLKSTWEFTPLVGIEEYSENLCSVFPNPSNDAVNVLLNPNIISQGSFFIIEICDVTGKVVRKENKMKFNGSINIEKESMPSGIYFFSISNTEKVLGRGKIVFE
ncbi:MAG: T9SS type A sorting domain-containing protein [Bacteroidetes bacterium]|nr:T9SS type A sorting domain-containing protein [Bacteroidota bacterium]